MTKKFLLKRKRKKSTEKTKEAIKRFLFTRYKEKKQD